MTIEVEHIFTHIRKQLRRLICCVIIVLASLGISLLLIPGGGVRGACLARLSSALTALLCLACGLGVVVLRRCKSLAKRPFPPVDTAGDSPPAH